MPHSEPVLTPEDPEQSPPPKSKRWLSSEKMERITLAVAFVMIAAAIHFTLRGPRTSTGDGNLDILEILNLGLVSQVEPKHYDPSRELRLAVAEYDEKGELRPFVMILRGPWDFGTAEIESVALALGQPKYRGDGFLLYDLAEGKLRMSVLFSAQRLDTIAVAPNPCPDGQPECDRPRSWGITKAQIADEALVWEPAKQTEQKCGTLEAAARGLFYDACPAVTPPADTPIQGIYVQRLTVPVRNPPHIRGVSEPGRVGVAPADDQPAEEDYARLLAQFVKAGELKAGLLGPQHSSVHFLRFETGRMLAGGGRGPQGAEVMLGAIQVLEPTLGKDHPDVLAMRTWLPAAPARKSLPAGAAATQ
jgi:hypothetical protein